MAGTNGNSTDSTPDVEPVWLPVIKGDRWFNSEHRPFILCVEYLLSAEEIVAALYGVAEPQDIATDVGLRGTAAVTLSIEGLPGLIARAADPPPAARRHDRVDRLPPTAPKRQRCGQTARPTAPKRQRCRPNST